MQTDTNLLATTYLDGGTQLDQLAEKYQFEEYREALRSVARRTIVFDTTQPVENYSIGETRFAGLPDLPGPQRHPSTDGQLWLFLAQINLSSVAGLQTFLPRSGLLSFFTDDSTYASQVKVICTKGSEPLSTFDYCGKTLYDECYDEPLLPAFHASVSAGISLPHLYNDEERLTGEARRLLDIGRERYSNEKSRQEYERYSGMVSGLARAGGSGESHLANSYVFTQHESPQETAAEELGGIPSDYINLMTFSYDSNTGFQFCDAGTLTFVVHREALRSHDFSKVIGVIEAS